jgi:hypothetical protein
MKLNRFLFYPLLLLLLISPQIARAGNYEGNFMSGGASMVGGAVTALTNGCGAIWYNPAGLGGLSRKEASMSGSAFMFRHQTIYDAFQVELPGETINRDLSSNEFISIPSSLVFAWQLKKGLTAGFGLFVPEQGSIVKDLTGQSSTSPSYRYHMNINTTNQYLYVGPAIGWQVLPRLRIGMNLLGVYYKQNSSFESWASSSSTGIPSYTTFNFSQYSQNSTTFGILGTLGLQWELLKRLTLGAVIKSPALILKTDLDVNYLDSYGTSGVTPTPVLSFTDSSQSYSNTFGQGIPMKFTLGLGYKGDSWSFAIEGDYYSSLSNQAINLKIKPVLNFRAGGTVTLSPKFTIGAGLFTDRSTGQRDTNLPDSEYIDSYGGSLGITYSSLHELKDDPRPDAIAFSSTLALRFSMGNGEVGAVNYNPLGNQEDFLKSINTKQSQQEFSIHISTRLYFK